MATRTLLTVDDYYAQTVVGDRKQLVGGEIVVNEPNLVHQRIMGLLFAAIWNWVAERPGRGEVFPPVDVRLTDHDLYGPDLVYVRRPQGDDALGGLPDLCVEIRSAGTWRYDVGRKRSTYESAGLPELWLVDDVGHAVLVFRRSRPDAPTFDVALELGPDDTLTSPLMPGLEIPLGGILSP